MVRDDKSALFLLVGKVQEAGARRELVAIETGAEPQLKTQGAVSRRWQISLLPGPHRRGIEFRIES